MLAMHRTKLENSLFAALALAPLLFVLKNILITEHIALKCAGVAEGIIQGICNQARVSTGVSTPEQGSFLETALAHLWQQLDKLQHVAPSKRPLKLVVERLESGKCTPSNGTAAVAGSVQAPSTPPRIRRARQKLTGDSEARHIAGVADYTTFQGVSSFPLAGILDSGDFEEHIF